MKVPLAELIAATGRRKEEYFFRPAVLTASAEIDLTAIYLDIANAWATACRERILPAYELPPVLDGSVTATDADGAQLQWLINQVEADINRRVIYQTEKLGVWVTRAGERHGRATISAVKSATGVDVTGFIRMTDVRGLLENSIRENTALITNLSQDAKRRVEQVIFDGFARRRSKRDITAAIAEAMGITKRRARTIATDQAHKLQSVLTQYRNEQLGVKEYIWRTMRDDRVRKMHQEREGKRFRWDRPPSDGHPGYPINCRCVAEAVFGTGKKNGSRNRRKRPS